MSEIVKYRPDIDGLRAMAVLPVVLYHAGFGIISGGFVGVDVFFVISGYLITLILTKEISEGRFSLLKFYDRRVRRILPAYFLVAIVTSLFALWLLPPVMLTEYGGYLISTAVFLSNFYFRLKADYFSPRSDENLLLHTWSLSVEEQFYIIWPLLLCVLMLPAFAKWRRLLLLLFFFGSLALASFAAVYRPVSAFYYSPLRAWELLLGAFVALQFFPVQTQARAEKAAAAGLTLIVLASLFYGCKPIIFPGLSALLPCGGAALIIWAGEGGRKTLVGGFLSSKPLVKVGLISYSLYLWHWPIFALAKIYLNRDISIPEGALLVLVSFAAAWLSWRFVEQRFKQRGPSTLALEIRSVTAGVLSLLLLAGIGWFLVAKDGLPGRAGPDVIEAQNEAPEIWRGTKNCLTDASSMADPDEARCRFGDTAPERPLVVLWGDSHANHYAPALDAIGARDSFTVLQLSKQSCSPLLAGEGLDSLGSKGVIACNRFRKTMLARIVGDRTVEAVVLSGMWRISQGDILRQQASLQQVVDRIIASGKEVVLIGPPPRFPNGGGRCLIIERFYGRGDAACYTRTDDERARLAPVARSLAAIAESSKHVHLFLPMEEFCDDRWCRPVVGGHVAFSDVHHLNVHGAKHLEGPLGAIFHRIEMSADAPP